MRAPRASARRARSRLARALAAAALLGAGCGTIRETLAPAPQARPAERPGWLVYPVGALALEAPGDWTASGGPDRLVLEPPNGAARLEAWRVPTPFESVRACRDAAEESLRRGAGGLDRVRRHPTTAAGVAAVTQEADQGGWHGWAYALCDGRSQYRLFFTGRSPIPPALLETWQAVLQALRLARGE